MSWTAMSWRAVDGRRRQRAAIQLGASLARCASGVMALPATEAAKPHWG
jgi:hypothetical protein